MRHLNAGRRLGVSTSHRRAMMRNMVTSVIDHEQIQCTLSRAKELRKPLDKMITLGKRGSLHARRQALSFVKSKDTVDKLFEELATRYKERQGGYSRIIKLGKRRLGDGSELAILQLIDSPNDLLSGVKKIKHRKATPKAATKTVLEEVGQEVKETAPEAVPQQTASTKKASVASASKTPETETKEIPSSEETKEK